MGIKVTELPPEVRERLESEGKLPISKPKRQTSLDPPKHIEPDKAHERLSRLILDTWRRWCLWCGVIDLLIILASFVAFLATFLRLR